MILLIDNYHSFVFNLWRYLQELGYASEVVRNDQITLGEIQRVNPSHIILSPGPCTPTEAGICLPLVKAFGANIPILGVCLGHQVIGAAFGARIVRARQPAHGKTCVITHDQQGLFSDVPNPLTVGLYHSLAIEEETIPDCFHIHAMSPSEDIMALSHTTHPIFGVQFHPESLLTDCGYEVLSAFMAVKTIAHRESTPAP